MFRKCFTVFMASLVLTSSMGFGVVEHHCMMRGKSLHLAAFQKQSTLGCGENHTKTPVSDKTSFQKQACCDDVQNYESVDVSSSLAQTLFAKIIKIVSDVPLGALSFAFGITSIHSLPKVSAFAFSFSSIFHGRDLLAFVQSFLI